MTAGTERKEGEHLIQWFSLFYRLVNWHPEVMNHPCLPLGQKNVFANVFELQVQSKCYYIKDIYAISKDILKSQHSMSLKNNGRVIKSSRIFVIFFALTLGVWRH